MGWHDNNISLFTSVINVSEENTLETFHKQDLFLLIETAIRWPYSNTNWCASLKCNWKEDLCQHQAINNTDTYFLISENLFCKLLECLLPFVLGHACHTLSKSWYGGKRHHAHPLLAFNLSFWCTKASSLFFPLSCFVLSSLLLPYISLFCSHEMAVSSSKKEI